jgi:LPS-assembly protein
MRAALLVLLMTLGGLAWGADAQPPPVTPSDRQSGPRSERATLAPLYLLADQLIYDTGGGRVISRGNVELYFNNYLVTADEMVYDHGASKLVAQGHARFKAPNGTISGAERIDLARDFVDAFTASLKIRALDPPFGDSPAR